MRKKGIRLIVYLDDTLVLAQSQTTLKRHIASVAETLCNLGFTLNHKKSVLKPMQSIEFLGFIVNSLTMSISLPQEKVDKIVKECWHMRRQEWVTPRQLAHLIGLLTSTNPAVAPAPLHYRALQRLRNKALKNNQGNCDCQVRRSEESNGDLEWWIHLMPKYNGRPVSRPVADLVLTSDASQTGWGATLQDISTGGAWSREERDSHINLLELKAAFFALQMFASHRMNVHVLLLIDNTTAIAYINSKGGTYSRALSALDLWERCMERKITIHVEHIPGKVNQEADMESRQALDSSDWKLNSKLFRMLEQEWGPFDVDLFAARHNMQLPRFFVSVQTLKQKQWMLCPSHGQIYAHMHSPHFS